MVNVPGAVADWPIRVFAIAGWRHDPGDLRQLSALHVTSELVEQVLSSILPGVRGRRPCRDNVDDLRAGGSVLEQRRVRSGCRVLLKAQQRIVGQVAGEGIARAVPESRERVCPARS